ncbi:MAG: hypothetical protein FWG52_00485 [Proteobacteria bacterium]|nr:hypothetical protein [Pseudomonadota bacterium]
MRYDKFLRSLAVVALLAVPFSAVGQQGKGKIGGVKVFSCEINGRPVFGDTLPKECYGRAWVQKVNGVVVFQEEAQPTPDESARRKKLARQQEEARKEAARQKRQDEALRERYPSLEALDQRRDREVAELDKAIGELRTDEERFVARRKSLDDEKKTLGNKPIPADLKKAMNYADEELAQARAAIERKVNERDSLHQRFDADRQHYLEITSSDSVPDSRKN